MRRQAKALLVVAALCSFFAIAASSAVAGYSEVGVFAGNGPGEGGSGAADGQLANPGQVDINPTTGKLYVADTGNGRVQVFAPNPTGGEYDSQAAVPGAVGLAIDQGNGDVYVATGSGIAKFDEGLAPIVSGWTDPGVSGPLAVDPATGDLLVADTAANLIRRFEADGTAAGAFAAERPIDLAANSEGDVFVVTTTGDIHTGGCGPTSTVIRYSGAGISEGPVGASLAKPGAVAVDPDDDTIAIAANVDKYTCETMVVPPELAFFEADGSALETVALPSNATYAMVPGLALQGGGARAYAVTRSPFNDAWGATQIVALESQSRPAVTIDSVDPAEVGEIDAAVSGSVNPQGVATDWWFEYRLAGTASWSSTNHEAAGSGTDPVTTGDVTLAGLLPLEEYEVRLVAESTAGSSATAPLSFTTKQGAPLARTDGFDQLATTSVRLRGTIGTSGLATTYHFEIGSADCALGGCTEVPGSAGSAAAAPAAQTATAAASGLNPSTTYHFRIVATNSLGTREGASRSFTTPAPEPPYEPPAPGGSCPNEAIREAQQSTYLPECRAYEQVSPVAKYNGGVVFGQRAANDGGALAFIMTAALDGESGAFAIAPYVSRRTQNGWITRGTMPRVKAENRSSGNATSVAQNDWNEDFTEAWVNTNDPLDPADEEGLADGEYEVGYDQYRMKIATHEFTWLSSPDPAVSGEMVSGGNKGDEFAGRSRDGERVFFISERRLVPDAPSLTLNNPKLYESFQGKVSLVGYDSNGAPMPTVTRPAQPIEATLSERGPSVISDDGKRIYFTDGEPGAAALFLRENGTQTIDVSSYRFGPDEGKTASATFLGAKRDGSRAYFYSGAQLTPEAPADGGIYRYDRAGDVVTFMVPGNAGILSTRIAGFASVDGKRLYFGALGNVIPGDPKWVPGVVNIYLWEELEGGGERLVNLGATAGEAVTADPRLRVTDDGRYAAFSSTISQDPGHMAGQNALYLFDAEDGSVECASCPPSGSPVPGNSGFRPWTSRYTLVLSPTFVQSRAVSSDGRLFFQSNASLLPQDSNGDTDVYMFDRGKLELLSPGAGGPSEIVDISADGDSVFIVTPNSLTATDTDEGYADVYATRVDGGFPEPPPTPAVCAGEGCQPPPATPPAPPNPKAGAAGPANCDAFKQKAQKKRKQAKKAGKKKAAQLRRQAQRLQREARNCNRGAQS